MAKRVPLIEVDLGDNGGLVRLWDIAEIEVFLEGEISFWRSVHQGQSGQPFQTVGHKINQMAKNVRAAMSHDNMQAAAEAIATTLGDPTKRIPLSTGPVAQNLLLLKETRGVEAARGALVSAVGPEVWNEGVNPGTGAFWRGMTEQVVFEHGLTPQSIEAAKRSLNGISARGTQVLAEIQNQANGQLELQETAFDAAAQKQSGRSAELERQWLSALNQFSAQASELSARLETTHATFVEHMKLRAPVEYWRNKAHQHAKEASNLRNWLAGFFVAMIGGYILAFAFGHSHIAGFLLQFEGNTGALLIVSAIFALLASLPLWVGRLLVKFYLSEHHLATDAREREIMTQTYLALTAEGVIDEKDRTLILGALFRSTPDGVVRDNTQPDTSPAAMLSKLLDSR